MREKVNVFYYPHSICDEATLKKAILFFDEIHFIDRPAFTFKFPGKSTFGLIGSDSPLRKYEAEFRELGVPLYVHDAPPGGPVDEEFYRLIASDINDIDFLCRFQVGISKSVTFRGLLIERGSFGRWPDADVAHLIGDVDLEKALAQYEKPTALFEDGAISTFDFSTPVGCAKKLIFEAASCSAMMNVALEKLTVEGFIPLSDVILHGDLLSIKYRRAVEKLGKEKQEIQLSDLSFAVFDELVSAERLQQMKISDVIAYRKQSETAREAFLEHLSVLQAIHGAAADNYGRDVSQIVSTEIIPAARIFRNRIAAIDGALYGSVLKGAATALLGGSAIKVFKDLSWPQLIHLSGLVGVFAAKTVVDDYFAARAARWECALSYVLSIN